MNIFKRIMAGIAGFRSPDSEERAKNDYESWFGGTESKTRVAVTPDNATKASGIIACVRLLSQVVATLPLFVYERTDSKSRIKAHGNPLYRVLHEEPNKYISPYELKQILMVNLLLYGYAYAEMVRDGSGAIKELWPIPSYAVTQKKNGRTREIIYEIQAGNETRVLFADKLLVIPWMSKEAVTSFEPVRLAREIIGLALASEQYAAEYFGNGTNVAGVLETEQVLEDSVFERFKKEMASKYTGLGNSHRLMFLEAGLKFKPNTPPNKDSQLIETRKFQILEAARFYGIPPHLVQDLERATFSNIEHQDLSFVKYCLNSYLILIQQRINLQLLRPGEKGKYFAEFDINGLLRGDSQARATLLHTMRQDGILSANEWRALENMNPIEGVYGDEYLVPLNMIPANAMYMEKPDDPEPVQNSQRASQETRSKNSAAERSRLAETYKKRFKERIQSVVNKELKALRKIIKDNGTARSKVGLSDAIRDYYESEETLTMVNNGLRQVFGVFSEEIYAVAANEVSGETKLSENGEKFIRSYTDTYSVRYTKGANRQLQKIINDAEADGQELDDDLNKRLDEWETKKANKGALNESIRLAGAISKLAYRDNGITKVVWISFGDACSYCQELNGMTVGIDRNFVDAASDLFPDDDEAPLRVYNNTGHPPLHASCHCMISASV